MGAESSKGVALREELAAASARLRDVGSPQLASAVDAILAPGAWGLLRNSDPTSDSGPRNFPIATTHAEKNQIKASAAAAGDPLVDRVNEGLRLFLSGEFLPEKPIRAARGTAAAPAVLNVRADEHLRDRAATECERLAGVLGWRPSVSGVAKAYLRSIYRI